MGIEVVDEQQEGLAKGCCNREGRVGHRGAVALRDRETRCSAHLVAVASEAAGEPVLAIQHRRAHDGRRVVAGLGQHRRQHRDVLPQPVGSVVSHGMPVRCESGHEARMSWKRYRNGRGGILEDDAFRSPPIEVGRQAGRPTVTSEPVGPRRVEADEQDRGPARTGGHVEGGPRTPARVHADSRPTGMQTAATRARRRAPGPGMRSDSMRARRPPLSTSTILPGNQEAGGAGRWTMVIGCSRLARAAVLRAVPGRGTLDKAPKCRRISVCPSDVL